MKRVSVAMAAYNGEKYLPEQIDSILSQLQQSDELVVSYNISTDTTDRILENYARKDHRVRVFRNPVKGITANFDNALAHCTGDYIFVSDQDDKWAPTKYCKVMKAFEESGADLVIHNGVHTDENLNPITEPFFSIYRIGPGKLKNFMMYRGSGCCMAFTHSMMEKIRPMPVCALAYDHWIGMVAECMGKITYLDDVLLYHRLHGDNATVGRRSLGVIIQSRVILIEELLKRLIRERRKGQQ